MCNVCFPTCGRCRPVSIVTFTCPNCGKSDSVTREEYLMYTGRPHKLSDAERAMHESNGGAPRLCKGCGVNLASLLEERITPASCRRSRILCGFPCGRHTQDEDPDNPCATMVPVGEYSEDYLVDAATARENHVPNGLNGVGMPGVPAAPGRPSAPGTPSRPGALRPAGSPSSSAR